jgi:hypothetical protein
MTGGSGGGGLVSGEAFGRLFGSFRSRAARLESRDRYADPEEDAALARFAAGEPEDPAYAASRRPWLSGVVGRAVAAGRRVERVRVVAEPLTEYQRFGLRHAGDNVAAGEDIGYLPRSRAIALDLPGHDFWLFDDDRVALLYFTADDRLLGAHVIAQQAVMAQHRAWFATAQRAATPYAAFAAGAAGASGGGA